MTLEQKIESLLPDGERFDVIAYELWGNIREGFDCNDAWRIAINVDREEAIQAARGRWEVFKVNYHPKARVRDIDADIGFSDQAHLHVDQIPFLEIRAA